MTFQFKCPSGCLLEGDPSQAGSTIQCPTCGQWFVIPAPVAAPVQPAAPQQPIQPQYPPQPQQPIPQQPAQHQPVPQHPPAPQQPAHSQPAAMQPPGQPGMYPPATPAADPMAPAQPTPQQPVQHQAPAQQQAPQAQTPQAQQSPTPQPEAAGPAVLTGSNESLESGHRLLHFPCPNGHLIEAPRELAGQEATCPQCAQRFVLLETETEEYKKNVEIAKRRREAKIGNAWLNWAVIVAVLVLGGLVFLLVSQQF